MTKTDNITATTQHSHRFCVSLFQNLCAKHQLALQLDTGKQIVTVPVEYAENSFPEAVAHHIHFYLKQLRRFGYEIINKN